ncbi:MAG: bifunctional glutamate N-acetyltransferase/amino-acid acetyltransferase ArgJ [Fibrobacter sp.]|jgi:glutamate N-acetyltransferase/amino-acid N-acetyltransferase|nr:bifunctional glutamate N-acetyltransferase/amino-acid acetyltransferase ArgJ [Fibrobacter sp.]
MVTMLHEGGVCSPQGFLAAGIRAGIKASGNLDLALLKSEIPARCFAVFTTNKVKAAPVLYDREVLENSEHISAVLINSGNANACTGTQGFADAAQMASLTENALELSPKSMLVCSTGIIGRMLPMDKIEAAIPQIVTELNENGSEAFGKAILTTDLALKSMALELRTEAGSVRIGGACKGSGMIHPNMATMLAFITTDILLPSDFQAEFKASIADSFNAITVDGDTSTNDTCILLSNGASGINFLDLSISEQSDFRRALATLMQELAKCIVRDGEGATKLIELRVEKAETHADALQMARFIGTSNLAKCAMFGEDPNWGRILSSAGSSGVNMSAEHTDLYFGDVLVLAGGRPTECDMNALHAVVRQKEYKVTLVLNMGDAAASAFTCDLSYDYVKINAEYTT